MAIYALTVFVSAFLLFQVQPMIAKIILPWFGGGAAVWSTCLMFFQMALLLGYLYSHLVTKFLRPRHQVILHTLLLLLATLVPIYPDAGWKPADEREPLLRIVSLLAGTVGLGYLMLATTGPLLQAWYTRASGGRVPYRLYALSNVGSFLALLTFPFVFEPAMSSQQQTFAWRIVFAIFVALAIFTGWRTVARIKADEIQETVDINSAGDARAGWKTLLFWVMLAACPSIMLSAISSHLTLNVAPMPFLWVLPLSIYLLTFILAFDSDRFYHRGGIVLLLILALGSAAYLLTEEHWDGFWPTYLWSAILFVGCMFCHGELANRKPHPRHLTLFFLMVSLGGALGGVFVGLVSPLIFNHYWELPISLVLCAVLALVAIGRDELVMFAQSAPVVAVALAAASVYMAFQSRSEKDDLATHTIFLVAVIALMFVAAIAIAAECRPEFSGRRYSRYVYLGIAAAAQFDFLASGRSVDWTHYTPYILLAVGGIVLNWRIGIDSDSRIGTEALALMVILLTGHLLYHQLTKVRGYRMMARNFYGVLKVRDYPKDDDTTANRVLIHGSINHGSQLLDAALRHEPTTYYSPNSGFGRALRALQRNSRVRVGITGLGAGVTAGYCRPGDYFRFYELNPLVLTINKSQFTFYRDCTADKDVYLGDGRLVMERQDSQQFDILGMDAFSSDSVPVHLLTRESFVLYAKHLRKGGVLAINVSNRYLDLVPIVARNGSDLGMTVVHVSDDGDEKDYYASTSWMLCTTDKKFFDDPLLAGVKGVTKPSHAPNLRPWTDNYSNLFQILKTKTE